MLEKAHTFLFRHVLHAMVTFCRLRLGPSISVSKTHEVVATSSRQLVRLEIPQHQRLHIEMISEVVHCEMRDRAAGLAGGGEPPIQSQSGPIFKLSSAIVSRSIRDLGQAVRVQ